MSILESSPQDRSRSGDGFWHRVLAGAGWARDEVRYRFLGKEDAHTAAGTSAALEDKILLSLPRLKQKGPVMALGLGDFIPSSPCNFFLPASRDHSRLNK